mmetsp:Transcript_34250/g.90424  ORF Transcript_34250/g.90424 Transcript_34250/m.90424 type:complete len:724 (+) Transcript_34250:68-2239(+)
MAALKSDNPQQQHYQQQQQQCSFDDLLVALRTEHAHLRAKTKALEQQLSALRPESSAGHESFRFSVDSDPPSVPPVEKDLANVNVENNEDEGSPEPGEVLQTVPEDGELPAVPSDDGHVNKVQQAPNRRRASGIVLDFELTPRGSQQPRPAVTTPRGTELVAKVTHQGSEPVQPALHSHQSGMTSSMSSLLSKSMSTVRPILDNAGSSLSRGASRTRTAGEGMGVSRFAVDSQEVDDETRHRTSVLQTMEELLRKSKMRDILRWLIHSSYFEGMTGLIILSNAALIGLETQHMALNSGQASDLHAHLHTASNAFFMVELTIRILVDGPEFFWNRDWRWNWLDTLLTLSSAADLFISVLDVSFARAGRALRAIRLLRLIRTLRLVRALRSVREFHKMVYAVLSSMRTLLCSMLILFFVMYFFAIMFCMGATEAIHIDTTTESAIIEELDYYFGTLPRTFHSLFLACSQGVSWHHIFDPLSAMDSAYGALFLFYIALILFGVMNVVTSVFVESAIMSAQHYKDLIIQEKQHEREIAVSHMKEVFRQIDTDGSGEIAADEMEYFLTEPGLRRYVEALGISAENTRMLFRLLDRDDSKKIDLEEFCAGCLRLQGEAKSIDVHTMIYQVRQFLAKWSEFTAFVEEKFEDISELVGVQDPFADMDAEGMTGMGSQQQGTQARSTIKFTLHPLEGGGRLQDSESEKESNVENQESMEFPVAPSLDHRQMS